MTAKRKEPQGELRDIEVTKLHLDPENPRLPEQLQDAKEPEILEYMVRDEALLELAESLADNGYFKHEPLLVVARTGDGFDVVEGNRRLATLLVLLDRPVAKGQSLNVKLSADRKAELSTVPCRVLDSREEVEPYVGYRHIGGMKKWPAEAKARYVVDQIEKLVKKRNDPEPFKTLGRRVGSNTRPMRHSYVSLTLLRLARDEGSFDLQILLDERRFGVWLRAYDTPKIRRYIGFESDDGEPTTYAEVRTAIKKVSVKRLVEVLRDFVPRTPGEPVIMDDSRDMSAYGAVLENDRARAVMRKRRSLDEARLLVTDEALSIKIERLARNAENLLIDVHGTLPDADLRAATEQLWQAAKALRSAANREIDE